MDGDGGPKRPDKNVNDSGSEVISSVASSEPVLVQSVRSETDNIEEGENKLKKVAADEKLIDKKNTRTNRDKKVVKKKVVPTPINPQSSNMTRVAKKVMNTKSKVNLEELTPIDPESSNIKPIEKKSIKAKSVVNLEEPTLIDSEASNMKPTAKKALKTKTVVNLDKTLVGSLDTSVAEQVKVGIGRRARKQVQLYTSTVPEKKAFTIVPGKGTRLEDIPYMLDQINNHKAVDLTTLHKILFGRPGTQSEIKKNIRQFSGFSFSSSSNEYDRKEQNMNRYSSAKLKIVCHIIGVKQGKVSEMVDEVLRFCLKPTDAGKSPETKKAKSSSNTKEKKSSSKVKSSGAGRGEKRKSTDDEDDYNDEAPPIKKPRGQTTLPHQSSKAKTLKKTSESEAESDEVMKTKISKNQNKSDKSSDAKVNSSDMRKKKVLKKGTNLQQKATSNGKPSSKIGKKDDRDTDIENPKKKDENQITIGKSSSSTAMMESDEGTDFEDDSDISDQELRIAVEKLVRGSNLKKMTMKMILATLCTEFPGKNLDNKKDFIKGVIKESL